jgi:hypothetical protein
VNLRGTLPHQLVLFVLCWLLGAPEAHPSGTIFERSEELPPLRMSYDDVMSLVEKARELGGVSSDETEMLEVSTNKTKYSLRSGFTRDDPNRAPEVAYRLVYNLRRANSPVSQIEIYLTDYSRAVRVSGTAGTSVDATTLALMTNLNEHTSRYGGFWLRYSGGVFLFLLLFVAAIAGKLLPADAPRPVTYLPMIFVLLILGVVWLPPWELWLAGFKIYQGSASLIVRYSAEISFLSFLLGLPGIVALVVSAIRKGRFGTFKTAGTQPTTNDRMETE